MLKTIAFTALAVALLGVGASDSFARGYGNGCGYGSAGYGGYGQRQAYSANAKGQFQPPCRGAGQGTPGAYGRGPAWAPQNGQPAVPAPGAARPGGV